MIRPLESQALPLDQLVDRVETALSRAPLHYGHGTDNPRDEAAWLVLEALGRSPVEPVADVGELIPADGVRAVGRLLAERLERREPLAYLTGRAWFAGLEFRVDRRALVPRSPLAEMIVERCGPWLPGRPVRRILDIGTGCGCIAVACAMAFPEAEVDAADIDAEALALAAENIEHHGLGARVRTRCADVFDGLPVGRYDLIISNPPYVDAGRMAALPAEYRHEPARALAAGSDGLDIVRRILSDARDRLTPRGLLVVEVGASAAAVGQRWPDLPFVWPVLGGGDEAGVFLLAADDLPARG